MNVAEVKIWGKLAGAVAWDETTGYATFEYDPAFRQLGWDLAPLKMPVAGSGKLYAFPELRKERNAEFDTFKGLPGLLADAKNCDDHTKNFSFLLKQGGQMARIC